MSVYEGLDPHEVLGVSRGADSDTIRQAWREAARTHHPDAGGDGEAFKRAQWALEMLITGDVGIYRGPKVGKSEPVRDETVVLDGDVGDLVVIEATIEHAVAVFGGSTQVTRWRMVHCPRCSGRGDRCETCNGEGRVGQYHATVVAVAPRTVDGDRIVIPGGGDAGRRRRSETGRSTSNAGPYGAIEIRFNVLTEGWIGEIGDDLVVDLHLGVYDAILGTETSIKGLDGRHKVIIPPGTQPGQRIRVAGRGRPRVDGGRGDLVAVIHVEVPQQLGFDERESLERLRRERLGRTGSTF